MSFAGGFAYFRCERLQRALADIVKERQWEAEFQTPPNSRDKFQRMASDPSDDSPWLPTSDPQKPSGRTVRRSRVEASGAAWSADRPTAHDAVILPPKHEDSSPFTPIAAPKEGESTRNTGQIKGLLIGEPLRRINLGY